MNHIELSETSYLNILKKIFFFEYLTFLNIKYRKTPRLVPGLKLKILENQIFFREIPKMAQIKAQIALKPS